MPLSSNTYKAIVRSLTPWAISLVAGLIAHFGWHPSNTLAAQIVGYGGVGLTVAVHALEVKFPWAGVFLGWLGAPAYAPSVKATLVATNAQLQAQLSAIQAQIDEAQKPSVATSGAVTRPAA